MDVIYKITYLPHLGTENPKWYIGSKKNWSPNRFYMGSVSSSQIFEYTDGLPLKDWWKNETRNNKERFSFEILETFDNISAQDLVKREKEIQQEMNVLSEDYFNQSIATEGYVSVKNTEYTKRKKSQKTKEFWNTPEGIEKRKRLSERNALVKSEEMKNRWKNPTKSMIEREVTGRPKGAKDLKSRKQRPQRKVLIEGILYNNAKEASDKLGIDPVNVRRRCRMEKYSDWSYV